MWRGMISPRTDPFGLQPGLFEEGSFAMLRDLIFKNVYCHGENKGRYLLPPPSKGGIP